MHGNPANNLYGGIKIAACGELGVGVGEEERGSGEREVLEGFVGRIEGLVDVVVSKFGDGEPSSEINKGNKAQSPAKPKVPWLGSGDEPAAEDGVIFLGTAALSKKSVRDVSHWVEDLYRWGPHAYGVIDNPSSNRRAKRSKPKPKPDAEPKKQELTPEPKADARQAHGLSIRDKAKRHNSLKSVPPKPIDEERDDHHKPESMDSGPAYRRVHSSKSFTSIDGDSNKTSKFVNYLKLGYGTHWSLGSNSMKGEDLSETQPVGATASPAKEGGKGILSGSPPKAPMYPVDDSVGHFLIGLLGSIEDEEEEEDDKDPDDPESMMRYSADSDAYNARLVLRTLTLELERDEDARAEADISIDLGMNAERRSSSKHTGSEHTGTSNASFESQDRNKTKKLRVVVYVNRPFIFVFLFELRTDALSLLSLYRSLHYQIGPLHKPLLSSTSYRASKPDLAETGSVDTKAPIYDLVYDPKLLTVHSTIPNIPDPLQMHLKPNEATPWSRIEALNTHMQIIQTYISTTTEKSELERTCKTSRGWWVVWTRVPDPEQPTPMASDSTLKPTTPDNAEESTEATESTAAVPPVPSSRGTSTVGASLTSGPAHPFLEVPSNANEYVPKDKEIFLIRRASDYVPGRSAGRFAGAGSLSAAAADAGWAAGPGKLAQGIGVDTKRYIEGLLNLNR